MPDVQVLAYGEQAEATADFQIDRNVRGGRAGEEGGHAGFAERHQRHGERILVGAEPDEERIDDKSHEEHGARSTTRSWM